MIRDLILTVLVVVAFVFIDPEEARSPGVIYNWRRYVNKRSIQASCLLGLIFFLILQALHAVGI